jgi:hypothetical protein
MQCALAFWFNPYGYAPAYELSGAVGAATIQAVAVLFLMWNVPYAVALWHPQKQRVSLYSAIVMQAIGMIGETTILLTLGGDHPMLKASIQRFIAFDAAGLVLLLAAVRFLR